MAAEAASATEAAVGEAEVHRADGVHHAVEAEVVQLAQRVA